VADRRGDLLRSRVARRLLALFLVCAVLPLVAISALTLRHVSDRLQEQSQARLRQASKAGGMALVTRLGDLERWMAWAAREELAGRPVAGSPRALPAEVAALAWWRPGAAPEALVGTPPAPRPLDARERAHLERGTALLRTLRTPSGRREPLLLRRVPAAPGALLVARLESRELFRLAVESGLPPLARYAVLDGHGQRLGAATDWPPEAARRIAAESPSGELAFEGPGERWLGGWWSVFLKPNYLTPHWTVVLAEPESAVLAPVASFQLLFPMGVALCLCLVSLLLLHRMRQQMRPLEALREGTRRIADRDFDVALDVRSGDEFEELARSFNAMAARLRAQFRTLGQMIALDRRILASTEERRILETVATGVRSVVDCDEAVLLLEPEESRQWVAVWSGRGGSERVPAPSAEERAALEGAPEALEPGADGWGGPLVEPLRRAHPGSWLLLPLFVERRLAGAMALAGELGAEGVAVARQVADQVGVAISNARSAERSRILASYDTLTGLPNRLLFKERLGQAALRLTTPESLLGVYLIDLDGFKRINDTLGHEAGDALLRAVADRLRGTLAPGTLARLGADEFAAVVVDPPDPDALARTARRILSVLEAPFHIGGRDLFLTASVGLAVGPADGRDADRLLRNADAAVIHAKGRAGSDFRFYRPSMNEAAVERLELENRLRRGVERGEFQVYYQPLVEAMGLEVAGAEALVRWQDPEHGMISPGAFIPLAEETGLIVPLGREILRTACRDVRRLEREEGVALRVSVNLSVRQLSDPTLLRSLDDALSESGLPAERLVLEITESMLMDPDDEARGILEALRERGVGLAIDDFGTGYSSLGYLKHFRVDHLKIDRTFVNDVTRNADDAAITGTIIAMGHGLGLRVVAEGVETEEQLAFLRENRCDLLQGFLFSPPLPLDGFRKLLRASRPD